jgi:hypothetical protein
VMRRLLRRRICSVKHWATQVLIMLLGAVLLVLTVLNVATGT